MDMTQVDTTKARKMFNRVCKGCDEQFQTVRCEAEFCSDQCRKCWHNLAMTRGRDLYPLVMAWRDQSKANEGERKAAMSAICALVATYRAEDEGKKRFDSVATVKARLAHIFNSKIVGSMRAGR